MKRLLHILLLLCALGFAHEASAQYYTWGSDPAGLKWSTIRTPDVRMIYPDTVSAVARRTLFYIRTVRPDMVRCVFPSSCTPKISSRTDW